ncbi:MAG: Pr6Pr family membrane protein [Clostridia bacterium]|nr:Pr6Pr family membrane protein [Clostridia bacterium]
MKEKGSVWQKKSTGVFLMILGCLLLLSIILRVSFYRFEYNEKFTTVDYGRFNYFSYFTVQSNLAAAVYCVLAALSVFGVKKLKPVQKPAAGLFITTYVIIAGIVYCSGFPMGLTPPLAWDTAYHRLINSTQVLHHMINPVALLVFWLRQGSEPRLSKRVLPAVGIYPFVYSLFCIVRGAFFKPVFYAYPFYNPYFILDVIAKGKDVSFIWGYVTMLPLLVFGISVFVCMAAVLLFVHNRQAKKYTAEK